MNDLQMLQRAIDYIEDHLLEAITYADAANHVHLSKYHFHRLFSMATGMTANEYIRKRKLTMAARELSASGQRIIDIALKYGYESPTSFTKAFTRFHGIAPNVAKRAGVPLKSQDRLAIPLTQKGGSAMDYRIVERGAFQLLTRVKAFRNESISEENNTDIPNFWRQCEADGTFDALKQRAACHDIYGACAPISKDSDYFDYGVGMLYRDGGVPDGFRLWNVPASIWAVFPCTGADGACIGETWDRIFKEFLPQGQYAMLDSTDFELYPANAGCFCEIWIPVTRA